MNAILDRRWLLPLGVIVGYALLMGTNPVRHCLLDGLRALRRYRRIWAIPAGLGICYALFHAALVGFFYIVLPMDQQPAFGWNFSWYVPPWTSHLREAHSLADWCAAISADPRWQVLRSSCLEGLEGVAGLFNNVVTTFPLSAVAAVLLLANWENHHFTLRQALRKRCGRWAVAVHLGVVLCAVSAILDPFLFGPSLIYLNTRFPGLVVVRWSEIINWFGSIFTYLFGVGVQVYLILVVYTWLRGINWTPVHLMDMAIRRFSIVVKWAAVVMAMSALLIDLPSVFAMLFRFDDPLFVHQTFAYIDRIGRPLLAIFLIFFSTMQITLTFHSETLKKAMTVHFQFLRRYSWQLLWFLLIAAIHLLALAFLNRWLSFGLGGETTLGGIVWSFIDPICGAFLAAWLLSSWVSLYKRCETGRLEQPDWIAF